MSNGANIALKTSARFKSALFNYIEDDNIKPTSEMQVTGFKLPNMNIEGQTIVSRLGQYTLSGETLTFGEITVNIICDEKFENWKSFFRLANAYNLAGTMDNKNIEGDSYLEIYDSLNKYLFRVVMKNSKLRSVSELDFTTSESNVISFEVTIAFDKLTIE